MPAFINRVGHRFGRLTVIARAPWRTSDGKTIWLCDCENCGKKNHAVRASSLKSGTKSCGCLRGYIRPSIKGTPLTQERLKGLLDYDPASGVFNWKVDQPGHIRAGNRAGSITKRKRRAISIDGKSYLEHRLAWYWTFGYWPKEIDHKHRDPTNSRVADLREATRSQNKANTNAHSDNRSGFKGVHQHGRSWQATITHNYKTYHLGSFSTPEAAHEAYCQAGRKLFGEFFHDGGRSWTTPVIIELLTTEAKTTG
jgi:hypothetical protein